MMALRSPGSKNTKNLVSKFEQMNQTINNENFANSDIKRKSSLTPRSIKKSPLGTTTSATLRSMPPPPRSLPLHNVAYTTKKNNDASDIKSDPMMKMSTMTAISTSVDPPGTPPKELTKTTEEIPPKKSSEGIAATKDATTMQENAACCVIL